MNTATLKKKGWFARNWKWLVVTVPLLMCLICGGAITAFYTLIMGAIKKSEPYIESMAMAHANAEVVTILGEPFQESFFFQGSINVTGTSGEADFNIPLSGPDGKGNLVFEAEKRNGQWEFLYLEFVDEQGDYIDLLYVEELEYESP